MDIIEYRQLEDFSNRLLLYISDEEQANRDYESLSNKATELGSHAIAIVLYEMSEDESKHKRYLEDMIARIKEILVEPEKSQKSHKFNVGQMVEIPGINRILGTIVAIDENRVFDYLYEIEYYTDEGVLTRVWKPESILTLA